MNHEPLAPSWQEPTLYCIALHFILLRGRHACLHCVPRVQVYAAYTIRRDLAEAAKPASLDRSAAAAAHLSSRDLQQQQYPDPLAAAFSSDGRPPSSSDGSSSSTPGQVPLEAPLMRQAIAWQLCYRELMHKQIRAAADKLKQELRAEDVRDLRVSRALDV